METAQGIAAILSAAGIGGVLTVVVNAIVKYATGAAGREKTRNTDLLTQLSNAVRDRDRAYVARDEGIEESRLERDTEAGKRRRMAEYASSLRRQLIEEGFSPREWPPDQTITRNTEPKEK